MVLAVMCCLPVSQPQCDVGVDTEFPPTLDPVPGLLSPKLGTAHTVVPHCIACWLLLLWRPRFCSVVCVSLCFRVCVCPCTRCALAGHTKAPADDGKSVTGSVAARAPLPPGTGLLSTLNVLNTVGFGGFFARSTLRQTEVFPDSGSDIETVTDSEADEVASVSSRHTNLSDRDAGMGGGDYTEARPPPLDDCASVCEEPAPTVTDRPTRAINDTDNHCVRLRRDAVAAMLAHYGAAGDVQTCTTVLSVLRSSPLFPTPSRPHEHVLWTRAYIGTAMQCVTKP